VPKTAPFRARPIENRTLVPESAPFRVRPQRAPSACTSGMKSHCCTIQNYTNASTHYVIPSAAKNLHGTTFTFVMKRLQVLCHFRGDRLCFCPETALGTSTLEVSTCAFVTKSLQTTRLWRGLRALSGRNCIRSLVLGNSQARGRP
jgi:hypothetical protein